MYNLNLRENFKHTKFRDILQNGLKFSEVLQDHKDFKKYKKNESFIPEWRKLKRKRVNSTCGPEQDLKKDIGGQLVKVQVLDGTAIITIS